MTGADPNSLALAAEFPAADRDASRALGEKVLKGVPYEKALVTELAEGIRTQPIYSREDALAPSPAARQADAEARRAGTSASCTCTRTRLLTCLVERVGRP